jgi:hypothetical protein
MMLSSLWWKPSGKSACFVKISANACWSQIFKELHRGPLSFDALGNRKDAVHLFKVENGYLIPHDIEP